MVRVICWLLGACFGGHLHAQYSWSYRFGMEDSTRIVLSCVEDGSGKVFVLGTDQFEAVNNEATFLHQFLDGSPVESARISTTLGIPYPNILARVPGHAGFIGLGGVLQAVPPVPNRPYANGFFRFSEDLALEETRIMEPALPRYGTVATCSAADGTTIGFGASYEDGPVGEMRFKTFRFGPTGDSLSTCDAYVGLSNQIPHTIHPWPTGGYLCASFSAWTEEPLHCGSLTLLEEDLCTVRWNISPPDVIPTGIPEPSISAICHGINAFPIGDRQIIVAGQSYLWTDTEYSRRTAVQIVDTNGTLVRQRTFYTTFTADLPAEFQGLDTTFNHQYYFAQMDGCDYSNVLDGIPSNIHVHLIDSLLNSNGEYVIDGYADNSLYELRRIRSALDGGVYLMGRVRDLNQAEPQWQGWIAKIGRSEFTTTVPERTRPALRILPNPGNAAFSFALGAPVTNAQLTVVDALGQLVHVQYLSGAEFHIDASIWPAGAYWLRVVDMNGTSMVAGRWLKQ